MSVDKKSLRKKPTYNELIEEIQLVTDIQFCKDTTINLENSFKFLITA